MRNGYWKKILDDQVYYGKIGKLKVKNGGTPGLYCGLGDNLGYTRVSLLSLLPRVQGFRGETLLVAFDGEGSWWRILTLDVSVM